MATEIYDLYIKIPRGLKTNHSESEKIEHPFYETLRGIKDAMFRRHSPIPTLNPRDSDLGAAIDYALSERGMGLA